MLLYELTETKYSDGYDSSTGMMHGRPYNDPMRRHPGNEPSDSEKLKYYQEKLADLKANPDSYKTHVRDAELMIRRYSRKVKEDVVDFPNKGAARHKQMDRLKRAGSQKYKDASYDSAGFLDDFTQNSLYPPRDDKPKGPHLKLVDDAAGVGIITKQNTTVDVKPGETGRQANKFKLKVDSKGTPKLLKP